MNLPERNHASSETAACIQLELYAVIDGRDCELAAIVKLGGMSALAIAANQWIETINFILS